MSLSQLKLDRGDSSDLARQELRLRGVPSDVAESAVTESAVTESAVNAPPLEILKTELPLEEPFTPEPPVPELLAPEWSAMEPLTANLAVAEGDLGKDETENQGRDDPSFRGPVQTSVKVSQPRTKWRLAAWWKRNRSLRYRGLGGTTPRPLQIQELAQAAEEHLRVASLHSLRAYYLPTRLEFRVSETDWQGLLPFEEHLVAAIRGVYSKLASESRFETLQDFPVVVLFPAGDLEAGDPPVLASSFVTQSRRASWWPGFKAVRSIMSPASSPASSQTEPPAEVALPVDTSVPAAAISAAPVAGASILEASPIPEAVSESVPETGVPALVVPEPTVNITSEDFEPGALEGVFELVATPFADRAQTASGTARQMFLMVCLAPTLPLRFLVPDSQAAECVGLDEEGQPVLLGASGHQPSEVPSLGLETLPTIEPLNAIADVSRVGMAERQQWPVFYARPPGKPEVFWAPAGLWIVGRLPGRSHWQPAGAPRNLSGRHLALLFETPQALSVVDLGSTNGLYQRGRRLDPWKKIPLGQSSVVEVGTEGAFRLQIHTAGVAQGEGAPEGRLASSATAFESLAAQPLR